LAGVGSRFAAAFLDYLIQLAIIIALGLALGLGVGLSPGTSGFAAAVWVVLSFLLFVGYDVTFEVLAAGRTPGKRANGLRVVREDGGPVTFPISAARNVLRIIDILPGMYLVGILSIVPAPVAAQGYRARLDLQAQAVSFRGVTLDSVLQSSTVVGTGGAGAATSRWSTLRSCSGA